MQAYMQAECAPCSLFSDAYMISLPVDKYASVHMHMHNKTLTLTKLRIC